MMLQGRTVFVDRRALASDLLKKPNNDGLYATEVLS